MGATMGFRVAPIHVHKNNNISRYSTKYTVALKGLVFGISLALAEYFKCEISASVFLSPVRWHWFTPARPSRCCAGWPESSRTELASRASSSQVTSQKLQCATCAYGQRRSCCATSLTSIQASLGSVSNPKFWAVTPGSTTPRGISNKISKLGRRSSLKGEGTQSQKWHFTQFIQL